MGWVFDLWGSLLLRPAKLLKHTKLNFLGSTNPRAQGAEIGMLPCMMQRLPNL